EPNTLVWTEGMDEWEKAKDIDELNEIFNKTPPPIPKDIEYTFFSIKRKKVFQMYIVSFLIINFIVYLFQLIFVLIGIYKKNNNQLIYDDVEPSLLLFISGILWSSMIAIPLTPI